MEIDPRLQDLIVIIIVSVGSFLIYKWFVFFTKRLGKRWDLDITLIQIIIELIKYSILALALTIILKELGMDIAPIIVSLGVLGVAVGFAARDTLANYISGMFILGSKSFKVGDFIEISNQKGKVEKLGFRITRLQTVDHKVVNIPNSLFSKNPYINYTGNDLRRVDLDITIPYSFDLDNLIPKILDQVKNLSWGLDKPEANVLISELTDMGIKATVSVWTNDPQKVATYRSDMARQVKRLLVEKNE
jgi:small conductance mechanosensitive channel